MLLSSANAGRLHAYVANHLAAKQLADERTLKQADDNVASALVSLKTQEEEKVRLGKDTPDFSEQLMLTYIAHLYCPVRGEGWTSGSQPIPQ